MFGYFAKDLTEKSNHLVDWSRAANLISSGNHHYSREEVITRLNIVALTAISAYMGSSINNSKITHSSNAVMAIVSGVLGFTIAHYAIAIYPLKKKRLAIQNECKALHKEIEEKLASYTLNMSLECKAKIEKTLYEISTLSLSTEKNGNATQTWGRRRHLLAELNENLTPENFHENDWLLASKYKPRGM